MRVLRLGILLAETVDGDKFCVLRVRMRWMFVAEPLGFVRLLGGRVAVLGAVVLSGLHSVWILVGGVSMFLVAF